MKKLFVLVLTGVLLVGCSSAPAEEATATAEATAEATTEATATPEATAEATAEAATEEAKTADGVVADDMMSTVTVTIDGKDVSFLKADGFTADGEFGVGAEVTVTYTGDLTDAPVAVSLSVK